MMYDTRVRLEGLPSALRSKLGLLASEYATFTKVNYGGYKDGVRFDNGKVLSLQELGPGVTAWLEHAEAKPLAEIVLPRERVDATW